MLEKILNNKNVQAGVRLVKDNKIVAVFGVIFVLSFVIAYVAR